MNSIFPGLGLLERGAAPEGLLQGAGPVAGKCALSDEGDEVTTRFHRRLDPILVMFGWSWAAERWWLY